MKKKGRQKIWEEIFILFFFLSLIYFIIWCQILSERVFGEFIRPHVIVSIECWLRFESQTRPARFTINFLFITARAERKVRIALKKFTQVCSYVVCTQVRRHVHKQITERRYGEEKPGGFVFEESVLFTLGLGLIAP